MTAQVTTTAYGRPALETLRAAVARVKDGNAMAPVTVLVPNNVAGIVARRFLARGLHDGGNGIAAISFSTLARLAEQLAAPTLTAEGRRPATRPVTAATIRRRLDADPGSFARVAGHPSTSRALGEAMAVLRDVSDPTLTTLESASALVRDVIRLHRETAADLRPQWYDVTDLLRTATVIVRTRGAATAELGPVVLYLPQDLSQAESAFARSLAERTDLRIIAGLTGSARADRDVVVTLAALAPDFRPPASREQACATRVLNASDSDDEVRCVVREVVQALQSVQAVPPVPAHRIAVLYSARSPYARLLHEHLGSAGITTNGPGVRPVNERAVSRLVLGLLETGCSGFRRADVFRTLGEIGARDFNGHRISVSRWERVSREAGVVGGDDWETRLNTYLDAQRETTRTENAREEPQESAIRRAEGNQETAYALQDFVVELQEWFAAIAGPGTWEDLAAWARGLVHSVIPPGDVVRMPLEEQYAASVIERTLNGLAALDGTGSTATIEGLLEVLALELESALPRVGRFGEGVLVAPITHAIGLDCDVIYLVGLSEDLLPGRLRDDSLLPERVRELTGGQLPSTRARVDRIQRCLLAALSSASQVVASFPRGDLRRHTERLPSRWLLPTLRRLSRNPTLAATEWKQADLHWSDEQSATWLSTSPSFAGSLRTTGAPSTGQEWRVRDAWAKAATVHRSPDGGVSDGAVSDGAGSEGAGSVDEVLAAALAMIEARESPAFTRFDGNLAGAPGLPDFADGTRRVSPTRLERYAICPHEYFVTRMLHVEPAQAPEEQVEITPMDIGNLIHQSFDELISECGAAGELPGYGQPWKGRQRQRLQEIGQARAAGFEAAGLTGHATMWTRTRASLLATLDWMLSDDEKWRAGHDARVLTSELSFGFGDHPDVRIGIDGGELHFRGSADKVDQCRDGTLLVTDLKTGSAWRFAGLSEDNPVEGGEKLQLPVYAHAARARFGDAGTEVRASYWFVRKDRRRVEVPLSSAVEQTYAETVGLIARSMANGVFPPRAPAEPDFRWVTCQYCNPDGLGHADVRRRWEAMRLAPELRDYTAMVEPGALGPDLPGPVAEATTDEGTHGRDGRTGDDG